MKRSDLLRKIIISSFVAVPLLSSIISTVHLVDLFSLGNPLWISLTLAIAIEVGSIASFLTLSILSKLNKFFVWSIFIILFVMQVIGNVYYSYDWIGIKLKADPTWINSFKEMLEFFMYQLEVKDVKMYLALLIGIPIPLISVFLLKSAVDYLGNDADEEETPVKPVEPVSTPVEPVEPSEPVVEPVAPDNTPVPEPVVEPKVEAIVEPVIEAVEEPIVETVAEQPIVEVANLPEFEIPAELPVSEGKKTHFQEFEEEQRRNRVNPAHT